MEYFIHLPEFQVIICKECQYAVLPSHIEAHFIAKPQHGLGKRERQKIADEVAKIDGLIGNEETLQHSEFPFPPRTSRPIAALAEPRRNGIRCTIQVEGEACQYICCSIQKMQEHTWDAHRWKSQQKGRPKKRRNQSQEVPWQTGIHCQRFFKQGPKSGYFEVRNVEASPPSSPPGIASREDQFKAAKRELEAALRKAEEKERRCIEEADESREPNPWLRRVGWAAHLAGLDRSEIQQWVEMPDDEEPKLQILCKAFDWMIQDAQYTTVQEVVGQAALFEANRKEVNKEPQKPFDSWMETHTVQEYTRVWKQLLCYIFRAEDEDADKRPAYKLTGRQQIGIHEVRKVIQEFREWKQDQPIVETDGEGEESNEEIEFMGRIQREILRLCIDLLGHPLQDNEYKSAIISGLAVLGIRDDDGWLDAEDYTPKYSAVIKLARLMVVQEGYEQRQEAIRLLEERELTADEAHEKAQSYFYFIRRLTHQFMTMAHNGQDPTPMQWIFKSRSYGFKIRYTTTAEGCIQWIGDNVLYQQIRFGMSQVRSLVHGLVEEARKELFTELMMVDRNADGQGQQAPVIDWESMVDNPSESRVGWSFLDDERTKFAVDGQWWFFERIFKEQKLRQQFINERPVGTPKFKKSAAEAYGRHVERFRELLLVLMHICGGQPGRAPEILGIRWKNTEQGGIRNIFIEDGLVALVTGYHKGYRSSNNVKIIHRYLPQEIGELLVYYLWLVLPFHEKLQFQARGERCSSPFLWGDSRKVDHRQWTGPKRGWRDRPGGSRNRRQAGRSQSPGVESEKERSPGVGSERESSPVADEAEIGTPVQEWTSERLRKIIQKASFRWMGVKLNISAWRQIAIAISRRYCRENPFQSEDPSQEGDASDEESIDDNPWDLQTGHGTHIAGMIYARELMEGSNVVIGRREKFRHVSQEWHKFLQFKSAQETSTDAGQKRKRPSLDDDMQHAQMARWKRLRTVDIHDELRQMLGDKAEFRGLQKSALEAIMENKSPILVIMGTGAGKSLLFQLPARSQKSGTTVVIVPLKSLERSLHQRCQEAGISCIRWDPQKRERMAQIVLVQPEAVMGKTFAQYLNKLQGLGQLDRIVIDECHTVLDSRPDFRPEMRKAGAMMIDRGVQMVYLTATLSPADEAEFLDIMKVEIPDDCKFRGRTSRPNIAYSIVEHDIEQTEAVCQLVAEKLQQYPAPAKMIVYSSNIETIKELASEEALNCHMYYADVGSAEEKEQIQQQWGNANGRVVVASNAFGLGIDQPDVRVVIHVGPIHQLRDYGQESGRGGRDGQRSEAIIMVRAGRQEALQKQAHSRRRTIRSRVIPTADRDQFGQEKVDEFISGERCRRIYLDQEMDGRFDRVRCEDGEEKCDVCQKDEQAIEEAETMRNAYIAEQERQAMYEQDRMLDSGINMPSSSFGMQASDETTTPSSSIELPDMSRFANHENTPCDTPQKSPISSIISSDPGFTADLITIADQYEFEAQQAEREQQRRRIQRQNQQEGHEVWELEQQLEEWSRRCPLCFIRGHQDSRHSIDDCVESGSDDIRKGWQEMKMLMGEKRWFELFSCCFDCHVPQAICQKWAQKKEQGRWERLGSVGCQFDNIIMPMVMTAMLEGKDWMIQMIQSWVEESGVEFGNQEQMYRWYGQKVDWGDIEASRLVQVFYRLAKGIEVE